MGPAAPGHPFEHDGKSYVLRRVTQGDKEELHAVANAAAITAVRLMAKHQSPEDAAADYAAVLQHVTSGYYWWDEPGGWAYRAKAVGFARLCWLCLKVKDEKGRWVRPEFEDVMALVQADRGKLLSEYYDLANADPTRPPPAGDSSGDDSTPASLKITG